MSKVKGQSPGPHNVQVIIFYYFHISLWWWSFGPERGIKRLRWQIKILFIFLKQQFIYLKKKSNQDTQRLIVLLRQPIRVNQFHSDNLLQYQSACQTTVWAVRVTNCENAAIWPMRIMQQMWPIGSGRYIWRIHLEIHKKFLECFTGFLFHCNVDYLIPPSGYITFHLPLFLLQLGHK